MYIAFPGMIRRDPLLNIRRRERESAGGLRGELGGGERKRAARYSDSVLSPRGTWTERSEGLKE